MQLERINVYYNVTDKGRYVPRAILVDLGPGVLARLPAHKHADLPARPWTRYVRAVADNNWANGHYTEGAELVDAVLNEDSVDLQDPASLILEAAVHNWKRLRPCRLRFLNIPRSKSSDNNECDRCRPESPTCCEHQGDDAFARAV